MAGRKLALRLLSAQESLWALEEAKSLCGKSPEEESLFRNACLLSRAVHRGRRRLYPSGKALMEKVPAEAILRWAEAYSSLSRSQDYTRPFYEGTKPKWELCVRDAGVNPRFDEKRFEELKAHGSSDLAVF